MDAEKLAAIKAEMFFGLMLSVGMIGAIFLIIIVLVRIFGSGSGGGIVPTSPVSFDTFLKAERRRKEQENKPKPLLP